MADGHPISIDPHIVPWSFRGSYLCLATRAGQNGRLTPSNNDICLVSHIYPAGLPLFALRPLLPGTNLPAPSGFHTDPSPVELGATPSRLTWTHASQSVVEATFQDVRTIRLRGSLPLAFDTEGSLAVDAWRTWLFRVPPPSKDSPAQVEFTSSPDSTLIFTALSGVFAMENEAPSADYNRRVTISPAAGDRHWELVIEERERERSTVNKVPYAEYQSFNAIESRMANTFAQYAQDLCPWQDDWNSTQGQTDQLGAYVMWTSTVRPAGYIKQEAVLMSKLWMNKVWSWDNCFNCLALAPAYLDTAINQMLLPFDWITPDGRLPDSITHSEILYDYTKPPIYGWTMDKLLDICSGATPGPGPRFDVLSRDQLTDIYHKVRANTLFWYTERKAGGLGVPWYSHGNDSGWDNATCYDRQTIVASPDLAAFLVVQNDFLARLGGELGHNVAEWTSRRDEMIKALLELWDDDKQVFCCQDAFDGSKWSSQTLLKFIPLVAAAHLPEKVVDAMVAGLHSHLTEWGLATEDPKSPKYEPDGYWRGPIWAPPTIIIESGLRQAGRTELANEISRRYQRLCDASGFAENYDAITGAGNRDLSYTWSASTYLVLRREMAQRRE